MDDARFDALIRRLGTTSLTRGHMLRGLRGGVLAAALGTALAADRTGAKKKKRCQSGFTKCTIKGGKKKKKKKKTFCVDAQNDSTNCGGCGLACASGQACQGGTCTCNGTRCAGCCAGDNCQAGNTIQQCGTNGAVCQPCGGGDVCNAPDCDQGTCGTQPLTGPACGICGTCNSGTCEGSLSEPCPVNEICDAGSCACIPGAIPDAPPLTCCPAGGRAVCFPVGHQTIVVAGTCAEIPLSGGCPTNHTLCQATEPLGEFACQACCPPGSTCETVGGYCRQGTTA